MLLDFNKPSKSNNSNSNEAPKSSGSKINESSKSGGSKSNETSESSSSKCNETLKKIKTSNLNTSVDTESKSSPKKLLNTDAIGSPTLTEGNSVYF